MRAAATVLVVAAVITIGGAALMTLTQSHGASTARPAAPGGATRLLAAIESPEQPPADIIRSIPLPPSTAVTSTVNHDRGSGTYNRSADLYAPGTPSQTMAFFQKELADFGWQKLSDDSTPLNSPNDVEFLASHPSSDGYYWEVGILMPAPDLVPPPLTTHFTLNLYEVPDPD